MMTSLYGLAQLPRISDAGSPVSENSPYRNCLINSWRASRPWCTAGARGQNGACLPPYTRSRDPKIGPTSIYQTVSLGSWLNRGFSPSTLLLAGKHFTAQGGQPLVGVLFEHAGVCTTICRSATNRVSSRWRSNSEKRSRGSGRFLSRRDNGTDGF